MLEILFHTPIYVWPLLAWLLWSGYLAKTTRVVSAKSLLILPTLIFVWSIYTLITNYETISILSWAGRMAVGVWLGSFRVRKLELRFDKEQNLIELAGSSDLLMLSILMFSLRYFLGVIDGLYPELKGAPFIILLQDMATVVSGVFIGRLLGFWQRFKKAPHTDLVKERA